MTEWYQKNLEVMKEVRPHLYECVRQYLDDNSYRLIALPDGRFDVEWQEESGKCNLYGGNPDAIFQQSKQVSEYQRARILMFEGFGLGYHFFDVLRESGRQLRGCMILEENPRLFLQALRIHDLTGFLRNDIFQFFVNVPRAEMSAVMTSYVEQYDGVIYYKRMGAFRFLPAYAKNGAYYQNIAVEYENAAERARSALPSGEDSYRGLMNLVRNLGRLDRVQAFDDFKGIFSGMPGLIVSTGPSLKYHLEDLKKNQHRFVIAACDSALAELLRQGIRPHLVFCIERVAAVKFLFDQLPKDHNIPLVTLPTIHPEAMVSYSGPIVMMSRGSNYGRWLWPERETFATGSTVSTMALRGLAHMGCQEIYLLGQDLAFDQQSRKSHVSGVDERVSRAESALADTKYSCEIPGNSGSPVLSTIYWKLFVQNFEQLIAMLKLRCFNVIPKDQGAKIANALLIEPADFWQQVSSGLVEFDAATVVNRIIAQPRLVGPDQAGVLSLAKRTAQFLSEIIQYCLQLEHEISTVYHEEHPLLGDDTELKYYQQAFERWETIQKKLISVDRDLYRTFLHNLFHASHVELMGAREDVILNDGNVLENIGSYINLTHAWIKELSHWALRSQILLESCY